MNQPTSPAIVGLVDIFNANLLAPNDNAPDGQVKTVWNLPRDMKTDIAVVLQAAIESLGVSHRIVVQKNGIFEQSKLRDPVTNQQRTVLTVVRTADVAERMSLGEIDGHYQAGDPRFTQKNADGSPTLMAPGDSATLRNQASNVSCDISIYDLNEMRADQVYLLVKTIMFAAEPTFQSLGYIKPPIRVAGNDSQSILDLDGGGKFVHERTLSYQGEHLDYIGAIDTLAKIIAVTQELEDDGATVSQTVNLS